MGGHARKEGTGALYAGSEEVTRTTQPRMILCRTPMITDRRAQATIQNETQSAILCIALLAKRIMKKLLWRIKYTYHHHRQLKAGWMLAWAESGSWLSEIYDGFINEGTPAEAVEETIEAWRQSC